MSSVEEYPWLTTNLFSASQAVIAQADGSQLLLPSGWGAPQLQGSGPPSKGLAAAPLIPASLRVAGMGMKRNL